MRFLAALQGDLKKIMAQEVKAAEQAAMNGMRQATDGLKQELRGQVTGAGLGQRLANTWRGKVFPQGQASLNAAGFVWNNAPKIVGAYAHGTVIHARNSQFLAIPTSAAGKLAMRQKMTPERWQKIHGKKLLFIYRRNAPSLLVAENMRARKGKRGGFADASATALRTGRGLTTVPVFILIPQVNVKKRFDIDSVAQKWIARAPQLMIQNWQENEQP